MFDFSNSNLYCSEDAEDDSGCDVDLPPSTKTTDSSSEDDYGWISASIKSEIHHMPALDLSLIDVTARGNAVEWILKAKYLWGKGWGPLILYLNFLKWYWDFALCRSISTTGFAPSRRVSLSTISTVFYLLIPFRYDSTRYLTCLKTLFGYVTRFLFFLAEWRLGYSSSLHCVLVSGC